MVNNRGRHRPGCTRTAEQPVGDHVCRSPHGRTTTTDGGGITTTVEHGRPAAVVVVELDDGTATVADAALTPHQARALAHALLDAADATGHARPTAVHLV